MAILTTGDKSVVKQKVEIDQTTVVIGRHPECDVIIDDGSVSRHHAQIVNEKGAYFLYDLNSRNGTYVNESQILTPTKLFDGSRIRICDVHFVFHLTEQFVEQPPRPTLESNQNTSQSVILDDDEHFSTVISQQLDIPSHYNRGPGNVSAEQKLQALLQITRALSESVRLNDILSNILECVFDLFTEADRGFIVMATPDRQLQPLAFKTRTPQMEEQMRISRTIAKTVMESKRPLLSSDAATDSRFDMSQSVADFRIRSIMCAPLINSNDESLGVIQLDTLKKSIAFSQEDLELLVSVAMQASLAIQKSDLFEEAKKSDELQADLDLAHELQLRFLPERNPEIQGYEFFSFYKPMQQVGGDYYDYIELDENRTGIIVADVVGHGIAAAMMMAKVSAEAKFALATTDSPIDAILRMNKNLSNMNIDRFVTLILGVLDKRENKISFVNAGHMPPILRKGDFSKTLLVAENESGLPLGVLESAEYEAVEVVLEPGDNIVMYTDGLNESMDPAGEQFTVKQMIADIEESQTRTPTAIGKMLYNAIFRHMASEPQIDDMCLVCVGRTGSQD